MKKKLLLLIWSTFCFGQNEEPKKVETQKSSIIKVYTPSTSENSSSDNSYKWAVKTDFFSVVSGEFPIIGEYRIAKNFSVEASAGLTYTFFEDLNIFEDDFLLSGRSYDTEAAMGSAFRATIKYFPSSDYDAIEGWYFGVQLYNRVNNRKYVVDVFDTDSFGIEGQKATKTRTGASLVIGKQLFSDSNVIFDFYVGLGLARVKTEDYYIGSVNPESSIETLQKAETLESKPNFQLGFRIGFGN
jgi:hypothetical protein